jgi:flagellar basal body-associated protein FliL
MALLGLLYIFLLFIVCFAFVHIIRLAYIGFKSLTKKPQVKEQKPEPKPKPVYYIVEKKRTRKNYSNPREIEFK